MIKAVVVADCHVDLNKGGWSAKHGVNRNWVESFGRLSDAVDVFIDNDADIFCIAGDLFNGGNPPAHAVNLVLEQMGRVFDSGGEVVAIEGNHCHHLVQAGHASPLEAYLGHNGAIVASNTELLSVKGITFGLLPWYRVDGRESVDDVSVKVNDDLKNMADNWVGNGIVLAHALVDTMPFGRSEKSISPSSREPVVSVDILDNGPWEHVFLGHVHTRQDVGKKAHYVGSTYKITAQDTDDKGCDLVTFDDDGHMLGYEFIPFKGRSVMTHDLSGSGEDDVTKAIEECEIGAGDLVTFKIDSSVISLDSVARSLSNKKVEGENNDAIVRSVGVSSESMVSGATTISTENTSIDALLREYLEVQGVSDIDSMMDVFEEVTS